jgi:pimeloyl-ACP methyl ester carboxylesterase
MLRSEGPGLLTHLHHQRRDGLPVRRHVRPAGPTGADLLQAAGVPVEYRSFPDVGHSMHGDKPDLYVDTLLDWVKSLDV